MVIILIKTRRRTRRPKPTRRTRNVLITTRKIPIKRRKVDGNANPVHIMMFLFTINFYKIF